MKARNWLHRALLMVSFMTIGCGGPRQPEEMIFVSVVTAGDPGQRDVRIVPDLDGASVDIWEYKDPIDPATRKKSEKPAPPVRSSRMSKADYVALWKAFPKGHIWNLQDSKAPGTGSSSAPVYTVELLRSGRHVKATAENPQQQTDKSAWQIIEPTLKAAGVGH